MGTSQNNRAEILITLRTYVQNVVVKSCFFNEQKLHHKFAPNHRYVSKKSEVLSVYTPPKQKLLNFVLVIKVCLLAVIVTIFYFLFLFNTFD